MADFAAFLASRKTEKPSKTSVGICDLTAPIFADVLNAPDFDIRELNKTYGAYVQHVLNTEHNQSGDVDKPEACKRHLTAMYAMLAWLAKADTNHVTINGRAMRLTLVPTTAPEPVPLPDKPRPGNPVAQK
jgi:hypothetical protein